MKKSDDMPINLDINEEMQKCTTNKKVPDDKIPKKGSWKQEGLDLIAELEDNNLTEASSDLSKNIEDIMKTIKVTFQEMDEIEKQGCGPIKEESYKESYILKLYEQVSKTRFDLDSTAEEIQGFVATTQLKTFQLNPKEHSPHFIVNHLWNLIGGDDENT